TTSSSPAPPHGGSTDARPSFPSRRDAPRDAARCPGHRLLRPRQRREQRQLQCDPLRLERRVEHLGQPALPARRDRRGPRRPARAGHGPGLRACNSGANRTQRLTVTLAHVPPGFSVSANTNFQSNLTVHGSGATVVLSQTDYQWSLTANNWSSIGFDTSFFFNGVDDLLIDIVAEGNDNGASSGS